MADVFLSYARDDRDVAAGVARALERQGFSVWWDPHVDPGRRYDEVIEDALAEAGCAVVLWSSASIVSKWVRAEAEEAGTRDVLIPVLIEDVKLPLAHRTVQAARLVGWSGDETDADFVKLVAAIRARCGRGATTTGAKRTPTATPVAVPPAARGSAFRNPLIVLACVSILFPVINLFIGAIPLAMWDVGGLAMLSPMAVTAFATACCVLAAAVTLNPVRQERGAAVTRSRRSIRWALVGAVAGLVLFLVLHQAVAEGFYYGMLGWESDDFRRLSGDIVLTACYAAFYALLTRAFALLGLAWAAVAR
jgi:hypothetical protein